MATIKPPMPYAIKAHTRARARQLGLQVRPSTRKNKKLDVYKGDEKVASVGDTRYPDYPTYEAMERDGSVPPGTAEKRRKAYHARHGKHSAEGLTPAYLAAELLW